MQNRLPNDTPGGVLARIVGALVGIIVMVGLFFLGLTVFAAAAGLALVFFAVIAVRVWWLRRTLRQSTGGQPGASSHRPDGGHRRRQGEQGVTLEGEYEERERR